MNSDLVGFPSPVGESYFSIIGVNRKKELVKVGFRPLSGNLIFQLNMLVVFRK